VVAGGSGRRATAGNAGGHSTSCRQLHAGAENPLLSTWWTVMTLQPQRSTRMACRAGSSTPCLPPTNPLSLLTTAYPWLIHRPHLSPHQPRPSACARLQGGKAPPTTPFDMVVLNTTRPLPSGDGRSEPGCRSCRRRRRTSNSRMRDKLNAHTQYIHRTRGYPEIRDWKWPQWSRTNSDAQQWLVQPQRPVCFAPTALRRAGATTYRSGLPARSTRKPSTPCCRLGR